MRNYPDWIKAYLDLTEDQESPELFWFWSGVGAIAATVGRSVFLEMGDPGQKFQFFRVFPNHFIFVVAKSAVCRKGAPTNMLRTMLTLAGTAKIMSQRISNAALFTSLKKVAEKTGKGEMLAWASELAIFLSKEEAHRDITTTFTDIYDCPPIFTNELKGSGEEVIPFPCLNLFAATNPTDLAERFPDAAIGKGFASRIHIIYQENRRKKVSRPQISEGVAMKLVADLQHIKTLEGTFKFSSEGMAWYDKWYAALEFPGDENLDSFYGRKHIHILKLAMVLSLAKKDDLIITPEDLSSALHFIEQMEANLPWAYKTFATTGFSRELTRICGQLKRRGGIASRRQLLHDNWYSLDKGGLSQTLEELKIAGQIQEVVDGTEIKYKLVGETGAVAREAPGSQSEQESSKEEPSGGTKN